MQFTDRNIVLQKYMYLSGTKNSGSTNFKIDNFGNVFIKNL